MFIWGLLMGLAIGSHQGQDVARDLNTLPDTQLICPQQVMYDQAICDEDKGHTRFIIERNKEGQLILAMGCFRDHKEIHDSRFK